MCYCEVLQRWAEKTFRWATKAPRVIIAGRALRGCIWLYLILYSKHNTATDRRCAMSHSRKRLVTKLAPLTTRSNSWRCVSAAEHQTSDTQDWEGKKHPLREMPTVWKLKLIFFWNWYQMKVRRMYYLMLKRMPVFWVFIMVTMRIIKKHERGFLPHAWREMATRTIHCYATLKQILKVKIIHIFSGSTLITYNI